MFLKMQPVGYIRTLHMCGGRHAWLAERPPELLATMVANLQPQRRRAGAEQVRGRCSDPYVDVRPSRKGSSRCLTVSTLPPQSAALAELKRELLWGLHAVGALGGCAFGLS